MLLRGCLKDGVEGVLKNIANRTSGWIVQVQYKVPCESVYRHVGVSAWYDCIAAAPPPTHTHTRTYTHTHAVAGCWGGQVLILLQMKEALHDVDMSIIQSLYRHRRPVCVWSLGSGTRVRILPYIVWLNIDMHASTGMHRHICNDVIMGVVISCHQFKASSVADCSCRLLVH